MDKDNVYWVWVLHEMWPVVHIAIWPHLRAKPETALCGAVIDLPANRVHEPESNTLCVECLKHLTERVSNG